MGNVLLGNSCGAAWKWRTGYDSQGNIFLWGLFNNKKNTIQDWKQIGCVIPIHHYSYSSTHDGGGLCGSSATYHRWPVRKELCSLLWAPLSSESWMKTKASFTIPEARGHNLQHDKSQGQRFTATVTETCAERVIKIKVGVMSHLGLWEKSYISFFKLIG